ncbi:MAG TPA: histidinol-phosphate transaminase [Pseudomonadales bacterium]|nr:histidinol-phosphate transaminase [Pseudomonadales bacterium]
MSEFWNSRVKRLSPYVPGEQPQDRSYIKLNTNENPYPPSPLVFAALVETVTSALRLYPDPNAQLLKNALAEHFALQSNQVFVGNGSDEVLAFCFQAFFGEQGPLLFPDISYSFYRVYCGLYDIPYQEIPLTDTFDIDVSSYPQKNGGIILPNPNAPTGKALPLNDIIKLLENHPKSVIVIDEAYVDFGAESAVKLIDSYPNLLVVQTFSKSRSLAGLRSGFALGNPLLIEALERIKNSFNSYPLDRFALTGSVAAIKDHTYFQAICDQIIASRQKTQAALERLGFEVLDSAANFLFARHPVHAAQTLYQQLKNQGILVRYFKQPRIDNFLRITIGTDSEMDSLINCLNNLLNESQD